MIHDWMSFFTVSFFTVSFFTVSFFTVSLTYLGYIGNVYSGYYCLTYVNKLNLVQIGTLTEPPFYQLLALLCDIKLSQNITKRHSDKCRQST